MSRTVVLCAVSMIMLAMPAVAQQKIKVGYVNTFSGPNSMIGIEQRDGWELGLDHLSRKFGGIDVDVIYEDDQQKPDVGKQVTEKLIQSDKVHFLTGYNWSNVLLASLKPAIDSETFIISQNAGPSQIAGELCNPWFFSVSWQNDQTPMALGEALNRKGIRKLFVLAPNYAAGKDMSEGVKRTFKGEVVGQEMTRWPGQLDFSAELSKVRAANPDAVWVFYPGAAGTQFFQQYAQAGLQGKIPLYSSYTTEALSLPNIKELALGSLSTQSWVNDLDNPVSKKFVADFRKKYGRYPSFYAAQSYDGAMLFDKAVAAVKGDMNNKEGLRAAMRAGDFLNTRGATFKFGHNHFPVQNFYLQEVVKDSEGTFTLKTVDTILKDHQDIYHDKCPMTW